MYDFGAFFVFVSPVVRVARFSKNFVLTFLRIKSAIKDCFYHVVQSARAREGGRLRFLASWLSASSMNVETPLDVDIIRRIHCMPCSDALIGRTRTLDEDEKRKKDER